MRRICKDKILKIGCFGMFNKDIVIKHGMQDKIKKEWIVLEDICKEEQGLAGIYNVWNLIDWARYNGLLYPKEAETYNYMTDLYESGE